MDGQVNLEWAETIVKELIKQGVRHFCIAYGNRSTPLVLAAAHHPLAKTHTHFDERGLGFLALGLAKSLKEPVAIIVTSGTALGNLLPAVMEASHDNLPLILLTADRPVELRESQANQTCNQIDIFKNYTRFFFEFPSPEPHYSNHFIQSTISHLVHRSLYPLRGPVHLNCPFREPFFDSVSTQNFHIPFATQYITPKIKLDFEDLSIIFEQIDMYDEGIIIVGNHQDQLEVHPIVNLSKETNYPIFTEIHSNLRFSSVESIIHYPTYTLKNAKKFQIDSPKILILIGEKFISKEIVEIIQSDSVECVIQISNYPFKSDPTHRVHHRVIGDFSDFSDLACRTLQKKPYSSYFQKWSFASKKISQSINDVFDRTEVLSEPILPLLLSNLATQDLSYFISNSMPIRYMNDFFHSETQRTTLFFNRGLSGIDGNIATAIGIQKGLESPLVCLIGDLATLHDLNSFALLEKHQKILFVICNNYGGGIFTKVTNHQPKEILDKFFIGKHHYQFSQIAHMFSMPYLQIESLDAFSFGLNQFIDQKSSMILEVMIDNLENENFLKLVDHQIQTQLGGIKSYFFS